MLDECKPVFVIAMVPHDQYLPIIQEVTKRRIHLLKGKPLARNINEANQFITLINKAQIQCMITLPRRFSPLYQDAYNKLDSIGRVFFLNYYATLGLTNPVDVWRQSKERSGGGCILDMGYHMIDILIWFLGNPHNISALYSSVARPEIPYDTEDTASIQFSFNDVAYGNMTLSRIIPPKAEIVKFVGEKGALEINNNILSVYDIHGNIQESKSYSIDKKEIAKQQIEYFCEVLEGKKENIATPEYNLRHMEFIEKCYSFI